jgi:hypothetical protein
MLMVKAESAVVKILLLMVNVALPYYLSRHFLESEYHVCCVHVGIAPNSQLPELSYPSRH